jgi:hypothetical protein
MVKKFPIFDETSFTRAPPLVPNQNKMTPIHVFILSHEDPLLGYDREISNYTITVAK